MRVYYVYVDSYNYDTYDGLVIVSENKEKALAKVKEEGYFKDFQGEVFIEEVELFLEVITQDKS